MIDNTADGVPIDRVEKFRPSDVDLQPIAVMLEFVRPARATACLATIG
jgi:hypothetical protein